METLFKPQQCLIKIPAGNKTFNHVAATYTGFSRRMRKHLFTLSDGKQIQRDNLYGISFDEISHPNNLHSARIPLNPEKRRSWK